VDPSKPQGHGQLVRVNPASLEYQNHWYQNSGYRKLKSKKSTSSVLVALVAVMLSGKVFADEPAPDKFRIAIGGFTTNRVDSSLSLTGSDVGVGASISPRDTLGIELESTVLRIEGHYRFNDEHALTYGWYDLKSTGDKLIEEEFDWVDENGDPITIPVGARAETRLESEIFKIGYLWSFYRSDKIEVAVGGGLHTTRLTIGLDASVTNPPDSSVERVDSTLPLPVLSFALNYRVTPKFGWYLKTEAFALAFDDYAGTYRDTQFGLEYRAWQNVGLGAALNINALNLEEDDSKSKLEYDSSRTGLLLYLATYF
jgi:hypothetical protein